MRKNKTSFRKWLYKLFHPRNKRERLLLALAV